jgi:hypothetical protein
VARIDLGDRGVDVAVVDGPHDRPRACPPVAHGHLSHDGDGRGVLTTPAVSAMSTARQRRVRSIPGTSPRTFPPVWCFSCGSRANLGKSIKQQFNETIEG